MSGRCHGRAVHMHSLPLAFAVSHTHGSRPASKPPEASTLDRSNAHWRLEGPRSQATSHAAQFGDLAAQHPSTPASSRGCFSTLG